MLLEQKTIPMTVAEQPYYVTFPLPKSMKAVFSGCCGLRMGSRLCWKTGMSGTQILMKFPIDILQNEIFDLLIFTEKERKIVFD